MKPYRQTWTPFPDGEEFLPQRIGYTEGWRDGQIKLLEYIIGAIVQPVEEWSGCQEVKRIRLKIESLLKDFGL